MNFEFNFTGLKNIYLEALNSRDKTLVFEMKFSNGRFLFMMFLSEEDVETLDKLFIYLRNVNQILHVKLYGNHKKGDFKVYLKPEQINLIIQELNLGNGNTEFDFNRFIIQMNNMIPNSINSDEKLSKIRENKSTINSLNPVDEPERTVLIGIRRVPEGRSPRDKTLRKLYFYTEGSSSDITKLIDLLKKTNMTVAWTTEDNREEATSIYNIILGLS